MKCSYILLVLIISLSCSSPGNETVSSKEKQSMKVKLITLDPDHFHAALVQKKMYDQIDSVVHVYAAKEESIKEHLKRVEGYNNRIDNPTQWVQKTYIGKDYFQKLLEEKAGNVVILAGNNDVKIDYIESLLSAGFNVFGDKPLVINKQGFESLQRAFKISDENNVILYDIMTERFNIFSLLQNELVRMPQVFGMLNKGTPDKPAIVKKSLHYILKDVSGKPLVRSPKFFDVSQQGEGITDIATHFVDLIIWGILDKENISIEETEVLAAQHWPVKITNEQFQNVTGYKEFPDYLQKSISNDNVLDLYSNGEFTFKANGVHSKISIIWDYETPEGGGDTYFSKVSGTKADIVIEKGEKQNYKTKLYIQPSNKESTTIAESNVKDAINQLNSKYPGISYEKAQNGWEIIIPDNLKKDHEEHFSEVMKKYLSYLENGELPEWEERLMLTKYFITTRALEISQQTRF